MSIFSAFVLIGSLQGILLSFALSKVKERDFISNKYLVAFLLVVSVTLLGRFFYSDTQLTVLKFKALFLGDCIIFIYGPLLYLWMTRLLRKRNEFRKSEIIHFLPSFIFIASIVPLFLVPSNSFFEVLNRYGTIYAIEELLAIIHNFSYIVLSISMIKKFEIDFKEESSTEPQTFFYKVLLYISLTTVILWFVSFFLSKFSIHYTFGSMGYQLIWFVMSATIFALGYYTIRVPEIFYPIQEKEKSETSKKPISDLNVFVSKIEQVMNEEKPYLNPKLKIAEFASLCEIQPHLMSRIINDHYKKNFFDFINAYRTEEFISKINEESLSQFTLLKLAFESGFNSKTTFNTSFKKYKGITPKEYISKESGISG